MLNLVQFMFSGTSEFYKFTYQTWSYYAIPFQTIFPLLPLILTKLKLKKYNSKVEGPQLLGTVFNFERRYASLHEINCNKHNK